MNHQLVSLMAVVCIYISYDICSCYWLPMCSQVKLAYQESELASQLKKLTLGPAELAIICDRAERLCDGRLKTRGDALLPIILASFIFDSLCASQGIPSTPPTCTLWLTLNNSLCLVMASFPGKTGKAWYCHLDQQYDRIDNDSLPLEDLTWGDDMFLPLLKV